MCGNAMNFKYEPLTCLKLYNYPEKKVKIFDKFLFIV
jgi:hypothetical protein